MFEPIRILCIEDEPSYRKALLAQLERIAFPEQQVELQANWHDGANAVIGFKPNVILLDLGLPDSPSDHTAMVGVGTLSHHAAVIVLTGQGQSYWDTCIQNGAMAYLPKLYVTGNGPCTPHRDTLMSHTILNAHKLFKFRGRG